MSADESRAGPGRTVYLCGVPGDRCSGSIANLSNGLKGRGLRCHASHEACFRCHRAYLVDEGWEQVGTREFRPPGGGPIRVLTKMSRFGAKMRPGKGMRSMPSGRRTGHSVSSL